MIRDVIPFAEAWRVARKGGRTNAAMLTFVNFVERHLGGEMVCDRGAFFYARPDLGDLFVIADAMKERGIIQNLTKLAPLPDEPRLPHWSARFRDGVEGVSGGSALSDDRHALTITLAETLERYLWFETNDYFLSPHKKRLSEVRGARIDPDRFAGFSRRQRAEHKGLALSDDSVLTWIQGESLVSGKSLFVPAQVVSAHHSVQTREPRIRQPITTGLATHPIRSEALLHGALEIIERDAYMLTWMNQLTPRRLPLAQLSKRYAPLALLVELLARYRLRVHVVRLPTDAPADAILAVVEDETTHQPRFSFGLKAHRDLARAAYGGILEAMRARRSTRGALQAHVPIPDKKEDVGHRERLVYWTVGDRHKKLEFLLEGTEDVIVSAPWEKDTPEEHLERIVGWCAVSGYECATVPLTSSAHNVTPWQVEMVLIPELQPLHIHDSMPYLGGARLTEIPRKLGYTPRELFTEEPHPFS